MSDFPLCERLGLRFEFDVASQRYTDSILAKDVEALLAKAPVVYGKEYNCVKIDGSPEPMHVRVSGWTIHERAGQLEPNYTPPTHAARLLMIEPIVKDTAMIHPRTFSQKGMR